MAMRPARSAQRDCASRLHAAQRLVQLQNAWEKDRAQLRQIAAELAVANRRLANAALTDLLTGLPNRRAAMDQLDQAWSAASRSGQPLAVMVIDIDLTPPAPFATPRVTSARLPATTRPVRAAPRAATPTCHCDPRRVSDAQANPRRTISALTDCESTLMRPTLRP